MISKHPRQLASAVRRIQCRSFSGGKKIADGYTRSSKVPVSKVVNNLRLSSETQSGKTLDEENGEQTTKNQRRQSVCRIIN